MVVNPAPYMPLCLRLPELCFVGKGIINSAAGQTTEPKPSWQLHRRRLDKFILLG